MGLLDTVLGSLGEQDAQSGHTNLPAALTNLLQNGGLSGLAGQFQNAGLGHLFESWVGQGANKGIAPQEVRQALGDDKLNGMAAQTGMSRDQLLPMIAKYLPQLIDRLTPQGRLPNDAEL